MPKQGKKKSSQKKLPTKPESIKLLKDMGANDALLAHCQAVSSLAEEIARKCGSPVNLRLVRIGGLLHDIGRTSTHGVTHSVTGGQLARKKKLPEELIGIIERHIGGGISKEDAVRLGLPKRSFIPETIEEKIVAHADNLIDGEERAPVAEAISQLVRMREEEAAVRILELHRELSEMCGIDLDEI